MWSAPGKGLNQHWEQWKKHLEMSLTVFGVSIANRRFKQYTSWNNIIPYHAHRTSHQVASKWPKSSWSPEICVWEPHGETNEIHLKQPKHKNNGSSCYYWSSARWMKQHLHVSGLHFHHGSIVTVCKSIAMLSILKFRDWYPNFPYWNSKSQPVAIKVPLLFLLQTLVESERTCWKMFAREV